MATIMRKNKNSSERIFGKDYPSSARTKMGRRALVAAGLTVGALGAGHVMDTPERPTKGVVVEQYGEAHGTVWQIASEYNRAQGSRHDVRDIMRDIEDRSPDLDDGAHPGDIAYVPMTDEEIEQRDRNLGAE